MFVLEVVTRAYDRVILVRDIVTGGANLGFEFQIVLWLWFTVLFANFAEAVAEGRGKAQADALRRTRNRRTQAKLLIGADRRKFSEGGGTSLKVGDVVVVDDRRHHSIGRRGGGRHRLGERGGDHRRGSAPVIRESGGRRPLGPSPAAPRCCPTGSRWPLPAAPGSNFYRPHDQFGRGWPSVRRRRTRSRSTSLLVGLTIIFVFADSDDPKLCGLCGKAPSLS